MWLWETLRDFFVVPIYHSRVNRNAKPCSGSARPSAEGENQPENIPSEFVVSLDETGRKVPLIGKAEVARQLLEARVRTEAVPDGVEILRVVPGCAARPRGETPPHSSLSHKLLVLQLVIQ